MTVKGVGVVGTGISGLTLALRLQQLGIDVTLYAESSAEGLRKGKLPNTVARFEHTLARERALGVDHFSFDGYQMECLHLSAQTDPPLVFQGNSTYRIQAVDFRVLIPRFLSDFEERGGRVVISALLFEAVPGSPLDALAHLRYDDDPKGFIRTVERLLAEHAPRVAERIDGALDLLGPDDLIQGALTPVVRRPWAQLPNGLLALAIGDAWITNDPIRARAQTSAPTAPG